MTEESRLVFIFSLADLGAQLELATMFVLSQVSLPGALSSGFSCIFYRSGVILKR